MEVEVFNVKMRKISTNEIKPKNFPRLENLCLFAPLCDLKIKDPITGPNGHPLDLRPPVHQLRSHVPVLVEHQQFKFSLRRGMVYT